MAESDIPKWLNSSFFETALRSAGYGPNVTVTSSEIGRATAPGENFFSDIFRAKLQVTVDSRRSTLSLILKLQLEKGELATVYILFSFMIHLSFIRRILKSNTMSILLIFTFCYTYIRSTDKQIDVRYNYVL